MKTPGSDVQPIGSKDPTVRSRDSASLSTDPHSPPPPYSTMATSSATTLLLGNQPGDAELGASRDQPEQGSFFDRIKPHTLSVNVNLTGIFVSLICGFCVAIDFFYSLGKTFVDFLAGLGKAFVDFLRGLFLLDSPETPNDTSHIVVFLLRWLCVLVVVAVLWLFLRGPHF